MLPVASTGASFGTRERTPRLGPAVGSARFLLVEPSTTHRPPAPAAASGGFEQAEREGEVGAGHRLEERHLP